ISALLNYDRRNETEIIKNDKSRRKIFALSLVCGVAGTALLITGNLPTGTLGSVLIVMFLYGFFISFSSGVPAFFDKRPRIKYAKTHLLVYRSLASKLNTTGVTMATISLLITATLLCEGAGFIFNTIFERRDARATNHDLYIYSEETETGFEAYKEYISAHIPVRESREYTLYNGETGAISKWLEETVPNYLSDNDRDLLLKMSDYAALRKMLGFPEARLEPGAYIIHCMDYLKNKMENYHAPLTLGGQTLAKGAVYTEEFSQWDGNGENFILAVPDEMAENLTPAAKIYALMTVEPVRGEKFTALRAIQDAQYEARLSETPAPPYYSVQSKAAIRENTAFMNAVFVFPLFYLSIVLTMTAATILTIQLLSEAGRYRKQYALLRSQGMDARDMNRSLRRQFALFYAMPALPPVLICLTFMLAQIGTLDAGVILNRAHAWGIIGLTLAVFFVIYLIYIAASYISFKRSVLPE
ncbi:MAG: ABC transporter permease, partial [Clostridiales bacterium]|nr:ABC transporter permease [Clostridiales bacterium]